MVSTWRWQSTRLNAGGAAWPGASRRQRPDTPLQSGRGGGPDSPVLAVLSIPTSTLPPSPPLRLLCAEAAFRCLVLQGGERAREGRLTPAKPRRQDKRDRERAWGSGQAEVRRGTHMEKERKSRVSAE